jgi:hypothetical protein
MKMRPYETDPAHIDIKFYYACVDIQWLSESLGLRDICSLSTIASV